LSLWMELDSDEMALRRDGLKLTQMGGARERFFCEDQAIALFLDASGPCAHSRKPERDGLKGSLMFVVFALVLGFIAGLRTMMAPAAASWAARLGMLAVAGTPVAFMGYKYTAVIFTVLALGEVINDKLPKTPSRKTPPQFIGRIVMGSLVGATVGAASGSLLIGLIAGASGAVAGTLGGAAARGRLAAAFGRDMPAALIEDAVAAGLSLLIVTRL
jgi:uncharacterized membrane protein